MDRGLRRAFRRPGSGRRRTRAALLLGLAAGLGAAALALWEPAPVRALRELVFDQFQAAAPRAYDPDNPVRVVAIDDESLARIGRWPWPREKLAELVAAATAAGAAATAIDILLAEPEEVSGTSAGDMRLAESLAAGSAVLGLTLAERGTVPEPKAAFAEAGDSARPFAPHFPAALAPLPLFRSAAAGFGAMNWLPYRDLVVREIPTIFTLADRLVPSLDIETLRVAQGASTIIVRSSNASGETAFGRATGIVDLKVGDLIVPTGRDGAVRIRYAGSQGERRIPAWELLQPGFDRTRLDGRLALIGTTAAALTDIRATPLEPAVPGIDIRAELIESLAAGAHLARPDFVPGLEALIAILGALAGVLIVRFTPPLVAAGTAILALGALGTASFLAFDRMQLLLDPVMPGAGILAAFSLAGIAAYRATERERQQIRTAFAHYLSPTIVETLAEHPERLALGGEMRELTVLFSDIRGFTARSEMLSPEEVVAFINRVMTPLSKHVLESRGTVDKYLGDGMMCFWNAPLDHPDHVRAALRAALKMQRSVAELDAAMRAEAEARGATMPPVALGIGIHTGPACVGNVGSLERFDYSAIGDTVNMAARIEPLCKDFSVPVIVSGEVADRAPDFAFLFLGCASLRGRRGETRLYALHGEEQAADAEFAAFRERHDAAVERARAGEDGAGTDLERLAQTPIGRGYGALYRAMIVRAAAHPARSHLA